MTRRFAVLGHPVGHSLSPDIHAEFYSRMGVDATYGRADVAPGELPAFVDELTRTGAYDGLNVTYPHKEAMFAATRPHDMVAAACGAVNTLARQGDGPFTYSGANTDGEGFCLFLERELAEQVRGMRVVMLGAGGSARSVLWALAGRAPASLTVLNRSPGRFAEPFFATLKTRAPALDLLPADHAAAVLERADLVIHATPVGLGSDRSAVPWPVAHLAHPLVVDLNYRAAGPTPFLAALPANARAHDGLGMLLYQAAVAFERWFGRFPDVRGMLENLRKP